MSSPSTNDLIAAVQAAGSALAEPRSRVPAAAPTAVPGSCTWQWARRAIHGLLQPADNVAAYLIIGAGLVTDDGSSDGSSGAGLEDVGVEIQWPALSRSESSDAAVRVRLGRVAATLACLGPAVDSLEAFVVDPAGRTLVYAIVPGSVVLAGANPLPPAGVRIYRMADWTSP